MTPTLTIGRLAQRAGVGVETIRFYEREGLLAPAQRRASGYRQYSDESVSVLRFIRRAKELGFTLKEIKSLLALRLDQTATRPQVRRAASAKLADIESRIADLQRMHAALRRLIDQCHGTGALNGCPILEAIEGTGELADRKAK